MDFGTGAFISPTLPNGGGIKFIDQFKRTALTIHKLFQQTLKAKVLLLFKQPIAYPPLVYCLLCVQTDLQRSDFGGPWSDKSLVALREVSVLFSPMQSPAIPNGIKDQSRYWVTGWVVLYFQQLSDHQTRSFFFVLFLMVVVYFPSFSLQETFYSPFTSRALCLLRRRSSAGSTWSCISSGIWGRYTVILPNDSNNHFFVPPLDVVYCWFLLFFFFVCVMRNVFICCEQVIHKKLNEIRKVTLFLVY